jgi:hypothetical protein
MRHVHVCWCGALSLWRENGSVVYNCCWSMPAQSFSGPSLVEPAAIFYYLKFEISFFVAPTSRRATVEVFHPASTRDTAWTKNFGKKLTPYCHSTRHGPHRKWYLQHLFLSMRTSLPSFYIITSDVYTDRPIHSPLLRHGRYRNDSSNNSSTIIACIRCRWNVFTEPLPSNEMSNTIYRAFA